MIRCSLWAGVLMGTSQRWRAWAGSLKEGQDLNSGGSACMAVLGRNHPRSKKMQEVYSQQGADCPGVVVMGWGGACEPWRGNA